MNNSGLQKKLKRQVRLASLQMTIGILFIIGMIIVAVNMFNTVLSFNGIGDLIDDLTGAIIFLFIATWILLIVLLIVWIMGIVNAVAINKLTNGETSILVFFSVITFTIVHLIVAVITKKKYESYEEQIIDKESNAQLNKLKRAFQNDVITSKEYEAKKVELEKEQNNN